MKFAIALTASLALLVSAVNAVGNVSQTGRNSTKGAFELGLIHESMLYNVKVWVGSEKDLVNVLLDGKQSYIQVSSLNITDSGVRNSCSHCTTEEQDVFDETKSSTFHTFANDSKRSVPEGSLGFWGHDSIEVHGLTMNEFPFLVTKSVSVTNDRVLGIGHPAKGELEDESFVFQLKNHGIIKKAAYSLFLNSSESSSGSVLLGGVDHAKYKGPLVTFPNLSDDFPSVLVQDLYTTDGGGRKTNFTNGNTYPAMIDVGLYMTLFPADVLDNICAELDCNYHTDLHVLQVPCTNLEISFNFNIGGVIINVPYNEFVWGSDDQCYISNGIWQNSEMKEFVLGQDFLRRVYAVIDLEDNTVSLAPIRYTNEQDIEVISKAIPSATNATNYTTPSFNSSVLHTPLPVDYNNHNTTLKGEAVVHGSNAMSMIAFIFASLFIF